ncbi:hypothetical protein KA005_15525 [bacterium]|nr:hypothetical protein [bacterium]
MEYTKEFKGKTIKDIKIFCDDRAVGIVFDDDTYTAFYATRPYEDIEVEHSDSGDYDHYDLHELGVISDDEHEKAKAEETQQHDSLVERRELDQYERIKEKYNL